MVLVCRRVHEYCHAGSFAKEPLNKGTTSLFRKSPIFTFMNLDYNYSCEYSVELVRKLECDDIAPLDDVLFKSLLFEQVNYQ